MAGLQVRRTGAAAVGMTRANDVVRSTRRAPDTVWR